MKDILLPYSKCKLIANLFAAFLSCRSVLILGSILILRYRLPHSFFNNSAFLLVTKALYITNSNKPTKIYQNDLIV